MPTLPAPDLLDQRMDFVAQVAACNVLQLPFRVCRAVRPPLNHVATLAIGITFLPPRRAWLARRQQSCQLVPSRAKTTGENGGNRGVPARWPGVPEHAKTPAITGVLCGAGDGNRTRAVSLGS